MTCSLKGHQSDYMKERKDAGLPGFKEERCLKDFVKEHFVFFAPPHRA